MKFKLLVQLALISFTSLVWAQDYPNKPVKILVGYVAGGSPDFVARALAQKLSEILNQSFLVENKPGGGGITATAQLVKMAPDGYSLLLGDTSQLGIAPYIFKTLPYDTLKDLTSIAGLTSEPLMIVSNSKTNIKTCLLYTSPSPRDGLLSRMPSSA